VERHAQGGARGTGILAVGRSSERETKPVTRWLCSGEELAVASQVVRSFTMSAFVV
jgi:hypothetical protein